MGWHRLDMTAAIRSWLNQLTTGRKLCFLIDCSGCGNAIDIQLFNGQNRPFLLIYFKRKSSKPLKQIKLHPRVRRRSIDCNKKVDNEILHSNMQCCKERFYVNFKELGWDDWIIAPHGYHANYCRGTCNNLPHRLKTYHSHVIDEYRKLNRLNGVEPCCAPMKFSSMSLIYYENNRRIVKRDLPRMIVDECGCL